MEAVTEEHQDKFMSLLIGMESLNKHAKLMKLKILDYSNVLIFKNAKIVHLQQERNQETKEIVGLKLNIQFGKSLNMERFQELIKWKLKFSLEAQSHVVLMQLSN